LQLQELVHVRFECDSLDLLRRSQKDNMTFQQELLGELEVSLQRGLSPTQRLIKVDSLKNSF